MRTRLKVSLSTWRELKSAQGCYDSQEEEEEGGLWGLTWTGVTLLLVSFSNGKRFAGPLPGLASPGIQEVHCPRGHVAPVTDRHLC